MLLVRSYMSSEHTDRVIVNLKVLAALKSGDRIYTRTSGFEIAEASWYNTFTRWAQGDSRWVNLEAVKTLMEDATRILSTYMLYAWPGAPAAGDAPAYPVPTPEQSMGFVKTMVAEMEAAAHGLENLRVTYADDSRMAAHLDVTLQKIAHEVGRARARLGSADASSLVHPAIVISAAAAAHPTAAASPAAVLPAAAAVLPPPPAGAESPATTPAKTTLQAVLQSHGGGGGKGSKQQHGSINA